MHLHQYHPLITSERTRTAFRSFILSLLRCLYLYISHYGCTVSLSFTPSLSFAKQLFFELCYLSSFRAYAMEHRNQTGPHVSLCRRGLDTRLHLGENKDSLKARVLLPRPPGQQTSGLLPAPHAVARYPLPKAERAGASKRRPRVLLHASRIVHPPLVSRARLALPGPTRDSGASACKANACIPTLSTALSYFCAGGEATATHLGSSC